MSLNFESAKRNISVEEYRIGTLKRCEVEVLNVVETEDITPESEFVLRDLLQQIKVAIGD